MDEKTQKPETPRRRRAVRAVTHTQEPADMPQPRIPSQEPQPEDFHTAQFPQLRTIESENLRAEDEGQEKLPLFGQAAFVEPETDAETDRILAELSAALHADLDASAIADAQAEAEAAAAAEASAETSSEEDAFALGDDNPWDEDLSDPDNDRHSAGKNALCVCAVLMLICGALLLVRALVGRTQAVMLTLDEHTIGYVTPGDASEIDERYAALQAEASGDAPSFPTLAQSSVTVKRDAAFLSPDAVMETLTAAANGGYAPCFAICDAEGEILGYAGAEADILAAEEKAMDILTGRLRGTEVLPEDAHIAFSRTFSVERVHAETAALSDAGELLTLLCGGDCYTAEVTRYETVSERLPYQITYIENDENFDGVTTLVSPGTEGLASVEYRIVLDAETGAELSREEHETTVIRAVTNAVAYKGTAYVPAGTSTGTYIWPLPPLPDDELPLDENGQPYVPENPFALKNTYVSSKYGERLLWGVPDFHLGLDIVAPVYTEIYACDGGVVTWASYSNSYGYMVTIQHENGVESLYAHQAKLGVSVGDVVKQGQVIGSVGASGTTSGTHLHLEFRYNHVATDPTAYVNIPDAVYVIGE